MVDYNAKAVEAESFEVYETLKRSFWYNSVAGFANKEYPKLCRVVKMLNWKADCWMSFVTPSRSFRGTYNS